LLDWIAVLPVFTVTLFTAADVCWQ